MRPEGTPFVILIVEDEDPIAQALALLVEEAGYHPLLARHGKQAIEVLLKQRPDLIITDLMMPQMSGSDLIAWLHADPAYHDLVPPIVLMSAGRPHLVAGADAFLPKPFSIEEVERLIQYFLVESEQPS